MDSSISPGAQISVRTLKVSYPIRSNSPSIAPTRSSPPHRVIPFPPSASPQVTSSSSLSPSTLKPYPSPLAILGWNFSPLARWRSSPPLHGRPSPSPPPLTASSAPPTPSSPPLTTSSSSSSISAFPQSLQCLPPNSRSLTAITAIAELFWLHDAEASEILIGGAAATDPPAPSPTSIVGAPSPPCSLSPTRLPPKIPCSAESLPSPPLLPHVHHLLLQPPGGAAHHLVAVLELHRLLPPEGSTRRLTTL